MNRYQDDYEYYQSVFDELHAPDSLKGKVLAMTKEISKRKMNGIKKAVLIAATLAIVFALSNVVTYAATGETWIEHIFVHATVNGEEKDLDVAKTVDEDGNTVYEAEVEVDDATDPVYITFDGDELNDGDLFILDTTADFDKAPVVVEQDGRVYLDSPELELHEDITDDFKDGKAVVEKEIADGEKLTFTVEGTVEEYTVSYNR